MTTDCSLISTWTNPHRRLELRQDFPNIALYSHDVLNTVEKELHKHNIRFQDRPRIDIVYPQKDPYKFPYHRNSAKDVAKSLVADLKGQQPLVEWVCNNALVETIKLARSVSGSVLNSLTKYQRYAIDETKPKDQLNPFLNPVQRPLFIVVDDMHSLGTTIANMISYLTHNGGSVLTACCAPHLYTIHHDNPLSRLHLVQERIDSDVKLSGKFGDTARNTGSLANLAKIFSISAQSEGYDWSPDECMLLFEENLNHVGTTALALTDGECLELIGLIKTPGGKNNHAYNFPAPSFPELIGKIHECFARNLQLDT